VADVDPLAPSVVEQNISELSAELSRVTAELYKATRDAAQARHDHRVARAKAYLAAEGTVAEREAHAELAAADEMLTRELAEATEKALIENGRNVRAQLEGMRSLNANTRDAVAHATGVGA
jgi:hypothetical protein